MDFDLPEELKRYSKWHKASYGWSPFEPIKCMECGKDIDLISVYRCYDCKAPFHRDCLKHHCEESEHNTRS